MSRKKIVLDSEEEQISKDFLAGKFVKSTKWSREDLIQVAKNTKEARINLRLQTGLLNLLKEEAAREGIPYQTLINNILFKSVSGQLVDGDIQKQLDKIQKELRKLQKQKAS